MQYYFFIITSAVIAVLFAECRPVFFPNTFSICFILLWYQLILNVARFEWQTRFTMDFHIFHYQGSSWRTTRTFIFFPLFLTELNQSYFNCMETGNDLTNVGALGADGVGRIDILYSFCIIETRGRLIQRDTFVLINSIIFRNIVTIIQFIYHSNWMRIVTSLRSYLYVSFTD